MITLANAGVPMLFLYAPVLAIAFVPIVAIEATLVTWLCNVRVGRAFWTVALANLVSTVVGVPLTWLALVLLQMLTGGGGAHGVGLQAVTWQAPWLIPYEESLHWMIPAAGMFLCVPFYLTSALVEMLVLRPLLKDGTGIARGVWIANGATYGLLAAFWGLLLFLAVAPS